MNGNRTANEKGRVPCPYCAEWIRKEAKICPHCKMTLDNEQWEKNKAVVKKEEDLKRFFIFAFWGIIVISIGGCFVSFFGGGDPSPRVGLSVYAIGESPLACTTMQNLERAVIASRNRNFEGFQALVTAGACEIIRAGSRGEIRRLDNINGVRIAQVRFRSNNGNQAEGWIVVSNLRPIN